MDDPEYRIVNDDIASEEGDPYYFSGNFDPKTYPPMWTWRKELAIKVVREKVAESFALKIAELTNVPTYIELVEKT